MNKLMVSCLSVLISVGTMAADGQRKLTQEEIEKRKAEIAAMTPAQKAERKAQIRARMEARNGGVVEDHSRQRGRVLCVVEQKVVPVDRLRVVTDNIADMIRIAIDYVEAEGPTVSQAKKFLLDNRANLVISVVSRPEQPALLVAPEDRWAQVNVDALAGGDVLMRAQKEVSRALAFLTGAASTTFVETLVSPITTLAELDKVEDYVLPIDSIRTMENTVQSLGIVPYRKATYRVACKDGWAPAPTNDVQKTIWAEYHTLPSKPLEIKFESEKEAK